MPTSTSGHTANGNVVRLMTRPLASVFGGSSWGVWRAVLKAAFALALNAEERRTVEELTQRTVLPTTAVRELWLLLGRRSGKSIIAALIAVWATCCRSYALAPGETGVFMVVASDRRQARIIKRYATGLLRAHPALAAMIAHDTKDSVVLTNGYVIEIHTCSYRTIRGFTCIGAAVDEVAFWDSEDSANPDHEVLVALKAAMASVPDAMLVALTSVYARRGEPWRMFEQHFGRNDSTDVLVVNAGTTRMNPTIDSDVIEAASADDAVAADAEFNAIFRRDVEQFLPVDALDAVRVSGRYELPSGPFRYFGFIDPAGGTGADSMTMAIAHVEGSLAVLDAVHERRPPFAPTAVVAEFAQILKSYRIVRAVADRYAGSWPVEAFRNVGITIDPSDKTRSEIYLTALPMIMSAQVELLDDARLMKQLASLERRTSRQGRDSVDHPPRQHDDRANAAMGALVLAAVQASQPQDACILDLHSGRSVPLSTWARRTLNGLPSFDLLGHRQPQ